MNEDRVVISLLHATRGRANKALACRKEWMMKAEERERVEHLFAVDGDDEQSLKLLEGRGSEVVVVGPGGGCVRAWNEAAQRSRGELLVQLSDDWSPPRGWDGELLGRVGDTGREVVLAVGDGHRHDELLCMAVLTRRRYEEQGFLFYPGYKSVYSDTEFSYRAYRDGVVVEARDLIFTHHHPVFTGKGMDVTYVQQNAPERYDDGARLFRERNPEAPLTPHELKMREVGRD